MTALRSMSMRQIALPLLACLLLGASAQAGLVHLVSADRFIDVFTPPPPGPNRQSAAGFGPFDGIRVGGPHNTVQASQHSNLNVTGEGTIISAELRGFGISTNTVGNAESSLRVAFDVTAPIPYHLSYSEVPFFLNPGQQAGSMTASLTTPSGTRTLTGGATFSGIFEPGSYELRADALSVDSQTTGSLLTLTVGSAVPLPPACWAVVMTLPLLAGMMHRQRQARR